MTPCAAVYLGHCDRGGDSLQLGTVTGSVDAGCTLALNEPVQEPARACLLLAGAFSPARR